jgi:hypothetical protein
MFRKHLGAKPKTSSFLIRQNHIEPFGIVTRGAALWSSVHCSAYECLNFYSSGRMPSSVDATVPDNSSFL